MRLTIYKTIVFDAFNFSIKNIEMEWNIKQPQYNNLYKNYYIK